MLASTLSALFLAAAALGAPTDINERGNNNYHIVTKRPGDGHQFCLDVRDGKFGQDAPVQMWTCYQGSDNQRWHMAGNTAPNQGNLQITITNPKTHEVWCLATSELNYVRATLRLKRCDSQDKRQFWRYAVESRKPKRILTQWGLAMDVAETNWNDGAAIQVYNPWFENPNQHWEFINI